MERERYSNRNDAYGAMTNSGLFGRQAVETAAPVEPIDHRPRRLTVKPGRKRKAVRASGGESGSWYLTPLAAFGAAAAMAFGVFAGGNLLLNYDERISAFLNGDDGPPRVAERAFVAGTIAEFRPARPRPVRKHKAAETLHVEHEADAEVISEAEPSEIPDVIYESPRPPQREEARNDREKRVKDLEKIRDRQQKSLKEFLESSDTVSDN